MPADSGVLWQILVLGLLIGLGLGFAVAYALVLKNRRADSLQAELREQQQRFQDYRREVDGHFVQTSALFQDLTERHRAMYEHLAQGAQALCSDELLAQRLAVVHSRLRLEQRAEADPPAQETSDATLGAEAGVIPSGAPAAVADSRQAEPAAEAATSIAAPSAPDPGAPAEESQSPASGAATSGKTTPEATGDTPAQPRSGADASLERHPQVPPVRSGKKPTLH